MMLPGWLDVSVSACIRYANENFDTRRAVAANYKGCQCGTFASAQSATLSASCNVVTDILKFSDAPTAGCHSCGMLATTIYRYLGSSLEPSLG